MKKNSNKKISYIKLAFKLIEEIGWNNFSLEKLAKKESIKIEDLNFFFKDETELIENFSEMIDEQVIKEVDLNEFNQNSVKDNIFELIMVRFEKLDPYKKSLDILLKELRYKPKILNKLTKKIFNSLDLFLEISNAKSNYVFDFLKLNIMFIIYGYTFKIWLQDDSEDMSKTMAEVDKWLSEAEGYANKVSPFL
jgi:ubiquinone biosynthesis protein COQ9